MATKHLSDPVAGVQPKNPLHGITLEAMLNILVSRHGWDDLGRRIEIRCFRNEPSIASSIKFLRRTPWAREQVEALYLAGVKRAARQDDSA